MFRQFGFGKGQTEESGPFQLFHFHVTAQEVACEKWHAKDHSGRDQEYQQVEWLKESLKHSCLQRSRYRAPGRPASQMDVGACIVARFSPVVSSDFTHHLTRRCSTGQMSRTASRNGGHAFQ